MRYTALSTILRPGATELQTAQASHALVARITPLLGPMIEDMLFMQLRHMMETEAVNASERAAGAPLPGARHITAAFADLVGFTKLGEEVAARELGQLANRLADLARDVAAPPCGSSRRSATRRCSSAPNRRRCWTPGSSWSISPTVTTTFPRCARASPRVLR